MFLYFGQVEAIVNDIVFLQKNKDIIDANKK